jgi:hypothetical protein
VAALSASSSGGISSVSCDGRQWQFEHCANGRVSVCVDCAVSPCSSIDASCGTSYVVSGCNPPCAYGSAQGRIKALAMQLMDRSPPPKLLQQNISGISKTSFTLRMEMTSLGVVYCAAYEAPAIIIPNVMRLHNLLTIIDEEESGSYVALLTISNLAPATTYDIFCQSQSLDGVILSDVDVVNWGLSGQTACCKDLSVQLLVTSTIVGSDIYKALGVSVSSPPSEDIVLFLRTVHVPTGGGNNTYQYPFFSREVELTNTSRTLSTTIGLKGNMGGQFKLSFWLAGASANEYEISYEGDIILSVWSANEEPPVPVLRSARFSNNGLYLMVQFDSFTDKAGLDNVFVCGSLFTFPDANITTCQWTSLDGVVGFVTSSVGIGDSVTLLASKLKARCSVASCVDWKYAGAGSMVIRAPTSPIRPAVAISAPPVIGVCDNLTVDLTSSSGSGGRRWETVSIDARSSDPNVSMVVNFLKNEYKLISPTYIPRHLLHAGMSYTFVATLCNFLSSCSASSQRVVVSSSVVPVLSFVGSERVTIKRKQTLGLFVDAFTTQCDGSK